MCLMFSSVFLGFPDYSDFFFSLLIRGEINAVLGDVLGGSGGGFGRFGGMFWEVWGRVLDVKTHQNPRKKTIKLPY